MKIHDLGAEDIDQIEVFVSRFAFHVVKTNLHPSIHMETVLSLAAVYGEVTFNHVHDPRYREDPKFWDFRDRVRIVIVPRPELDTRGERLNIGITVRTRSGQALTQELRYPLMVEEEIEQKFRNLAGLRIDAEKVLELKEKIRSVETMDNVAPLVAALELDD